MKVFLHTREIEIQDVKSTKELIDVLKLVPNTVLVLKNGNIVEVADRERIKSEDKLEVVKVISGG
mgnify:CR=1 FL=1